VEVFNPYHINKCGGIKMHYLMIKKCMNTGLKYLCKTSGKKSPYLYKGSGIRWLNHIKKHNSYIITCIIGEYYTNKELTEAGIYYSKLYNVVDDYTWANLTEEKGTGGLIGSGQLGKTWKIKDTSNMKKSKTKTDAWYEGKKKTAGKNNYQFKGQIKTPWGIFDSGLDAISEGKKLRENGNTEVITDGNTLRKYLQSLDNMLNLEGRRTPKNWRGKTPRELGFDLLKDKNVKN
jgi:hypothetical protein